MEKRPRDEEVDPTASNEKRLRSADSASLVEGATGPAEDDEATRAQEDAEDDALQEQIDRRERERGADSRLVERYDAFIRCATPEQLRRFDHYKRSKFPRAQMRRLMNEIAGNSTEKSAIVLASLAKMFVGEMVETAREQMTSFGESGPIQPHRLRQAYRALQNSGVVPTSSRHKSTLFWRPDSGA
jgi:transcription initiation factor TFIID subunit 11